MNLPAPAAHTDVRSILLDIEGTTTPVDFVYKTLFPYARRHVAEFLRDQQYVDDVASDISGLRAEYETDVSHGRKPPSWREGSTLESAVAYVEWLMDHDRKSTALKALQGKIWHQGYRSGELCGEFYPDVLPAFVRWRNQDRTICIFSSGSVLAQKLLFSKSTSGDLSTFIWQYFDTTTGAKTEPESYRSIARACHLASAKILFVSDVAAELNAAREAGMDTALCVRESGTTPAEGSQRVIYSFDEIFPENC